MSHIYKSPDFITPVSLNVVAGGTPVGSITDCQSLLDGNVYNLPEVAGTPGFDLEFNFTDVVEIYGLVSMIRYDGTSTHDVSLRLYNYTDAQDDSFLRIGHTDVLYSYRTILIPDDTKYMNGSDQSQIIIYHDSSGNASHDLYVDYIALIGKRK